MEKISSYDYIHFLDPYEVRKIWWAYHYNVTFEIFTKKLSKVALRYRSIVEIGISSEYMHVCWGRFYFKEFTPVSLMNCKNCV